MEVGGQPPRRGHTRRSSAQQLLTGLGTSQGFFIGRQLHRDVPQACIGALHTDGSNPLPACAARASVCGVTHTISATPPHWASLAGLFVPKHFTTTAKFQFSKAGGSEIESHSSDEVDLLYRWGALMQLISGLN